MRIDELGTKVEISLGAIVFVIVSTWYVSAYYHNQATLEQRVEKQNARQQEQIDKLQENHK
jgi:hypothetical protein